MMTFDEVMQKIEELKQEDTLLEQRHDAFIQARDMIDGLAKEVKAQMNANSLQVNTLMKEAVRLKEGRGE